MRTVARMSRALGRGDVAALAGVANIEDTERP
jgi:hypothetical protein